MIVALLIHSASAVGPAEFITVQEATLEDGLRVVVVQQPAAQTASLVTVLDGGRSEEPAPGLARSAAQSWFSSDGNPVASVAKLYERMGAVTQLDVTAEHTVFTTRVPTDALPDALALEWLRFSGALTGVDELAPVSHEASREEFQARYLDAVFTLLYEENHPYRGIWADPVSDHPIYLASSWVTSAWRPDRATLVIVSPLPPGELLCSLDPRGCSVQPDAVVEAPLELPLPTMKVEARAPKARNAGPLSVGVDPILLASWTLPGTRAIGSQLPVLVRERIRAELSEVVPKVRCPLYPGAQATTLICALPADADREALDKAMRKGWSTKKLGKEVETWRQETLVRLLGSSAEPDFPERLATHLRDGGKATPYAGALSGLAFDETQVEALLKGPAAYKSTTWVQLAP